MPKEYGIVCPIRCGECCERYWRDIDELAKKFPDEQWGPCPHQKDDGCELPRGERPEGCNEHFCDKAEAILYPNALTQTILKGILARAEQEEKADGERRGIGIPGKDPSAVQVSEPSGVHSSVQESAE